jgi:hypothetical protein
MKKRYLTNNNLSVLFHRQFLDMFKVLISVILFFLYIPLMASQISNISDAQVIKTEHFDFIFATESTNTAKTLALVAEDYYKEIAQKLEVPTIDLHVPVVITSESDELNGYFTTFPYNRIVIYDTVVPAGNLEVFSHTVCSIFYHELTHAISLNIRSPFWNGMATVFGDVISPSFLLNNPTSFTEGVTVSFESAHGEGRLNDAFSTHCIKQAKIENCFPSLYDITGARDIYPSGSLPYIFGGAFSSYLQKTYGLEKYAEFWHESGKLHFFKLYAGILKKVYGKTANKLWDDFYESIIVPENITYPQTVLEPLIAQNTIENVPLRSFPTNVCTKQTAESGPLLVWQDASTGTVYGALKQTPFSALIAQKICSSTLSEHISLAQNANYFTISGYTQDEKPQNITQIYEITGFSNKLVAKFTGISIPELRDASIITSPEDIKQNVHELYVAGIKTQSQDAVLVVYSVNLDTKIIKEVSHINFESNQVAFFPSDGTNGTVLFLLKDKLDWSIAVYNLKSKKITVFPTNLNIKKMSVCGNTILLSCAQKKDGYPIYASLDVQDVLSACDKTSVQGWCGDTATDPLWTDEYKKAGTAKLTEYMQIYSGGVYEPVLYGENEIYFVSHFYDNWQLSVISIENQGKKQEIALKATNFIYTDTLAKTEKNTTDVLKIEPYNPFSYLTKGVFLPFSGITFHSTLYEYPEYIPLGLTWMSMDPTEHCLVLGGVGYDFVNNCVTTSFSAESLNSYNNWSIDSVYRIKDASFQGLGLRGDLSHLKPIGLTNWYSSAQETINFASYYHSGDDDETGETSEFTELFSNNASIGLLWEKNTGVSHFQYVSISSLLSSDFQYDFLKQENNLFASTIVSVHFPQIVPFESPKNLTVNIPLTILFKYYVPFLGYSNTDESSYVLKEYGWESTAILFSTEIQKGVPYVNLYARRVTLDAGCDGTVYDDSTHDISVHTSLYTTSTYNIGSINDVGFDIGIEGEYYPFDEDNPFLITLKFCLSN